MNHDGILYTYCNAAYFVTGEDIGRYTIKTVDDKKTLNKCVHFRPSTKRACRYMGEEDRQDSAQSMHLRTRSFGFSPRYVYIQYRRDYKNLPTLDLDLVFFV